MAVYYSDWSDQTVEGRSKIDLSSVTIAQLVGTSTSYNNTVTYEKGDTVLDQGALWVYVSDTSASGHAPPVLPDVSNVYWELVSIVASEKFTWIAYANSVDGVNFTDFTLAQSNEGGITRKWIGIAVNKDSGIESTNTTDYSWTKFVGEDGAPGESAEAPITATLLREAILVPTDSNGQNASFSNTNNEIRVFQGTTPLLFTTGTVGNGTWAITTVSIEPAGSTNIPTITDSGDYASVPNFNSFTTDSSRVSYNIQGKTLSGANFSIVKDVVLTKAKGAIVDLTPPAAPTGLALSSSIVTLDGGNTTGRLVATWTANTETDLSWYEVEIKEGTGNYVGYQTAQQLDTSGNRIQPRYEWNVKTNQSYTVRVRAVDRSSNRSSYSSEVSLTSVKDTTIPSSPTSLIATPTFKNIFLSWTNSADTDLDAVEIWRGTSSSSASSVKIATVKTRFSSAGTFSDSSGLVNGTLYYYWLKSVDSSGNVSSAFSSTNSTVLSGVNIAGISGQFSCTSTGLRVGQTIIISGTLTGTGSITGYSSPKTYVVSATNGTTTFTLVDASGQPLTTSVGTTTGLTFTAVNSAAVPAAVGTTDIIAGSITADLIRAGSITGDRLNITTYLPATITVGATGVSIGTVESNAATGAQNPATRINSGTTTIDPGKILISGSTTLANWKNGTDSTEIKGGAIAANTVTANKLTIGSRGLDISGIEFKVEVDANGASTGKVSWTSGTIVYTNDSGAVVTQAISSGNTGTAYGTDPFNNIGPIYLYWVKGTNTIQASQATGTAYGTDNVVLATYQGAKDLVVSYGRTIIDGSQITAGTITGDRVKVNSIDATRIDSRGLSIKDASGNIIFSAGDPLKWANITTDISAAPAGLNNGNIIIAGGTISGIGTGSGTAVANSYVNLKPSVNRVMFSEFEGHGFGFATTGSNYFNSVYASSGWSSYNPELSSVTIYDVGSWQYKPFLRFNSTASSAAQVVSLHIWDTNVFCPVTPGERLSITTGIEANNANTLFVARFYDASNNVVETQQWSLNGYQPYNTRIGGFALVPASAARLMIEAYFYSATSGAFSGLLVNPMVASVSANQTTHPEFVPGPNSIKGSNRTAVDPSTGSIQGVAAGSGKVVANDQVTVAAGTIAGIGTGNGTQVDNTFVSTPNNLIPNSDQGDAITSALGWNPYGATFDAPIQYASVVPEWAGSYILSGTSTKNLFLHQNNILAGGDDVVATDIYPLNVGGWGPMVPIVAGQRYVFSCYVQGHRCKGGVGIFFWDSSGALINTGAAETGPIVLPYGPAAALASYSRLYTYATAPANAASASLYIRKYNTTAGNTESYFWWAAPQLERVSSGVTLPGPYVPGPVVKLSQYGYTGDKNATYGASFGINIGGKITQGNASTYIESAAIGAAQIGSIALTGKSNFSVTSSTGSLARMEMDAEVIKVYDANNVLRVKLGNLT